MTDKAKYIDWLTEQIAESDQSVADIREGMRHQIQSGDGEWRDVTDIDLRKHTDRSETLTRMRSDVISGKLSLTADQMTVDVL